MTGRENERGDDADVSNCVSVQVLLDAVQLHVNYRLGGRGDERDEPPAAVVRRPVSSELRARTISQELRHRFGQVAARRNIELVVFGCPAVFVEEINRRRYKTESRQNLSM